MIYLIQGEPRFLRDRGLCLRSNICGNSIKSLKASLDELRNHAIAHTVGNCDKGHSIFIK